MDIQEELNKIAPQVERIGSSGQGRRIGTGLKDDIELSMKEVIPEGMGYQFNFNMGGQVSHTFYELSNHDNFITF